MSIKAIETNQMYSTGEASEILGLSIKQVSRLIDSGKLEGAERKSPVARSPRRVPGWAIIKFLELRKIK